jgi:hypothetical protein
VGEIDKKTDTEKEMENKMETETSESKNMAYHQAIPGRMAAATSFNLLT